ncbi:MAG: FAD-dependent oxidoreductase [Novosphingobium sp. SCN 66-18]|nr:MAG: FAD-dependent oxidoreductase [Novosphingobium sp. SCN 66-18]
MKLPAPQDRDGVLESGPVSIALIGAGPTSIYTLQALLARAAGPISITIFEEQARAGLGTPYRPGWNDPAMLANIASIELPPLGITLVEWLAQQTPARLAGYNIDPDGIDERTFYPRVVLGHYLRDRFEALVAEGGAAGHAIDVRARSRVTDIAAEGDGLCLSVQPRGAPAYQARFSQIVIATGHEWPDEPEVRPGFFASPWPASALKRIPAGPVGIRGTSLSAIDAAVALAVNHGAFVIADGAEAGEPAPGESAPAEDQALRWKPQAGGAALHITMMSRKGLMPEADFFCPIPHEPLTIFTEQAVQGLIEAGETGLLDRTYALFEEQLRFVDPDYADRIGRDSSVEAFGERYFAERLAADPFAWAQANLDEARKNFETGTTIPWRYAILRAHEVFARIVPHLDEADHARFSQHLQPIFTDNYATVPHASIERLLALHRAGALAILAVGDDARLDTHSEASGATMSFDGQRHHFSAFIDATGQRPLEAAAFPFQTLLDQGVVQDAGDTGAGYRGIVIDDDFRPVSEQSVARRIHLLSLPFILGRHPFIQGLTSCHDMGEAVGARLAEHAACAPMAAAPPA